MTIGKICVFRKQPEPNADVAMIFIADPVNEKQPIEIHQGLNGFHSVTIIRAAHESDIAVVLCERLSSLEFEVRELSVALFSDCQSINAFDAAYIAHIELPQTRIENQDGDLINGFKIRVTPVVESDFENGVIAAIDGITVDCNPYELGTGEYDKWLLGFQANHEGVSNAAT